MSEAYLSQALTNPDRLEVRDGNNNFLALFTRGAYTVTLDGPERTFLERDKTEGNVSVKHKTWVRTYPEPFTGELDAAWLEKVLKANKQEVPDILAIAMQYIKGAPPISDENGVQIAGDAKYGPGKGAKRREGADFNDYLGMRWEYPGETPREPKHEHFQSLDCSGFVRMIWGYRNNFFGSDYTNNIPLSYQPGSAHSAIPRQAKWICECATGIMVISDNRIQVSESDFEKLRIGDLVFFDGNTGTEMETGVIDHVGMFMGLDRNEHRFISSRKQINGPTLSDFRGKSVLDGSGYFAKAFRAARRL